MTYATVLPQGVVAARGAPHHQNRLGLALEAAHAFLTERLQRCQDDALTYITFDHEATVRFANAAVADATSLLVRASVLRTLSSRRRFAPFCCLGR